MSDIKLDGPRVVVEGVLDTNSRMRVRQNGDETAGIWFHAARDEAFVGMAADKAVGLYGTDAGWAFVMDTTNGNVGIGTRQTPPADVKLEVGDRMRVRQAGEGGQTAGIWFRQSKPSNDSAFVGMATDTSVGFWGNNGAKWGLVMDTTTGDVEVKKGSLTVQGGAEIKTGGLTVRGSASQVVDLGGGQGSFSVATSIVLEDDSIRVTRGKETIDLVAEVRRLRGEVDALQGKGKGGAPGAPLIDQTVLNKIIQSGG